MPTGKLVQRLGKVIAPTRVAYMPGGRDEGPGGAGGAGGEHVGPFG